MLGGRQIRQSAISSAETVSRGEAALLRGTASSTPWSAIPFGIEVTRHGGPHAHEVEENSPSSGRAETIPVAIKSSTESPSGNLPELGDHPSFLVIPIARGQMGHRPGSPAAPRETRETGRNTCRA